MKKLLIVFVFVAAQSAFAQWGRSNTTIIIHQHNRGYGGWGGPAAVYAPPVYYNAYPNYGGYYGGYPAVVTPGYYGYGAPTYYAPAPVMVYGTYVDPNSGYWVTGWHY